MSAPTVCLTAVMPCYNEARTVREIVKAVLDSPFTAELLVVDDGSSDDTLAILAEFTDERLRVLRQPFNQGKGAALRRGFAEATSPFVIIQDADLEYDPGDYGAILEPLLADRADVVYGSRFMSGEPHRALRFWHAVGNKVLTLMSNMATDLYLSDMETCYKAFRLDVIQSITLQEDRFGIEPELTAKVAAGGWRVYEVGITYDGRSSADGKKIGWRDGMAAVACIVRYSPLRQRLVRSVRGR